MNLANKYRPKTLEDVVGQKPVTVVLSKMIEKGMLPNAMIFEGSHGLGKTSCARIVAAELNKEFRDEVFAGVLPAFLELDAASNGLVGDIRSLRHDLQFQTIGNRVVVLDEAHSLSPEAFNVLLKQLEEDLSNVVFIFCTTELHRIPDNIQDRCHLFNFRKASLDNLQKHLTEVRDKESLVLDDDLIAVLAKKADGSFRNGLMLLEQANIADVSTLSEWSELFGDSAYIFELFRAFREGPGTTLAVLEDILAYKHPDSILEDVIDVISKIMILKSNAQVSSVHLDNLKQLAAINSTENYFKALKACGEASKMLMVDKIRGIQLISAMISEHLYVAAPKKPTAQTTTLSDIDL